MKYVKRKETSHGYQTLYRFDNDYGASVVIGPYTYGGTEGKFELAVVKFNPDKEDEFIIDYSTPITDDVVGYCTDEDIEKLLKRIEALPLEGTEDAKEEVEC